MFFRSVNDGLHSSDIQRDQMEGESAVNRRIIGEPYSRDIQPDEIEGEGGLTRSMIDELHF